MIGDQLSKQEDRLLHRALESVVRTQFPNPQRNECPGPSVLRAIATKRIRMQDPALDHVGHCSPCFSELTDMRRALHRRSLLWKTGSAAAAVVLAFFVTYVAINKNEPGIAGPSSQARYETALLDLRNASTARAGQPSGPITNQPAMELSRAILSLTIQLPIGSEPGNYEVAIRKPNESASPVVGMGTAHVEGGGITKLTVVLDTRGIPAGDYDLAWRMADFDWRTYPILIR